MRRINIEILCSPCYLGYGGDDKREVEGEPVIIAVGGWNADARLIDVCKEHHDSATLADWTLWYEQYGMTPDEVDGLDPEIDPDLQCRYEDCPDRDRVFATVGGRNNHETRMHGGPPDELD